MFGLFADYGPPTWSRSHRAVPPVEPRATNRNGGCGSFMLFVTANDCVLATVLPTNERMNSIHKSFCSPFNPLVGNYLCPPSTQRAREAFRSVLPVFVAIHRLMMNLILSYSGKLYRSEHEWVLLSRWKHPSNTACLYFNSYCFVSCGYLIKCFILYFSQPMPGWMFMLEWYWDIVTINLGFFSLGKCLKSYFVPLQVEEY